jgi:hypothetical protein
MVKEIFLDCFFVIATLFIIAFYFFPSQIELMFPPKFTMDFSMDLLMSYDYRKC